MIITIRARFDGKVLIPEEPVLLPKDQPLEVEVRVTEAMPSAEANAYAALHQLIGLVERGPEDASIHHDVRDGETP